MDKHIRLLLGWLWVFVSTALVFGIHGAKIGEGGSGFPWWFFVFLGPFSFQVYEWIVGGDE